MSTPSNLYAEKLLSEHPLAIWSLDDNSDYVSLISESFRNLNTWTISNGTKSSASSIGSPFPNSYTTQITGAGSAGTTTITSGTTFSSDSDGFTVGFYIQTSTSVDVQVGYTGTTQTKTISGNSYPTGSWIPVSFTFSAQATAKNLLIKLTYTSGSQIYYINGLTIGKNSEPFNGESLGQSLITLPTSIATTQTKGIEAKSFGNQDYSAYYIGSGNNIYAQNFGMPLSFGSANSAIIYPHSTAGQPSFIFPGFGFLNNDGKYKELTLEMLIRINANNSTPKRILGPLASDDGVYVTKEFITLKIGDNVQSFYLSELYKPMLLQVKIAENYAVLSIDGDDLISLPIESSALSLPEKLDESSKDQDWIGLFAYSDIKFIEVDSIAIYPYRASNVLAKTRLGFAQALEVPNNINSKYGGATILTDYGFANYVNNYNYPSFQAKWSQASTIDNFDIVNGQTLSTKKYAVAQLNTSLYDSEKFLKDLYATNIASAESNTFINLKPTSVVSGSGRSWSTNQGYLYADSFIRSEHLSNCIYGVFKSLETSGIEQILFKILNESNGDYIKASLTNTTVSYILNYGGTETTLETESITQNVMFAVGLDIETLKESSQDISSFFNNTNSLNIYIGGDSLVANTFSGNIYKVGLCSSRNFADISSLFASGILTDTAKTINLQTPTIASGTVTITTTTPHGFRIGDIVTISTVQPVGYRGNFTVTAVPSTTSFSFTNATTGNITTAGTVIRIFQSVLLERTATYTIGAINAYGKIILDIATNSYWQDYVPLSKLAKIAKDKDENVIMWQNSPLEQLDFIQLNIDYPETRSYSSGNFDTSTSKIKTYVTFQLIDGVSNSRIKDLSEFATSIAANENRTVSTSIYDSNSLSDTKFEFVNGTILNIPTKEQFYTYDSTLSEWGIVFHIELDAQSVNTNPYDIRSLQIAAKTQSEFETNSFGTRYSVNMYPYNDLSETPSVFRNYLTYKQSSPYLYLTRHSGIRVVGGTPDYTLGQAGVYVEIGNSSLPIKINSVQMSVLADIKQFTSEGFKIFEITGNFETISFYVKSLNSSNTKGMIYTDSTINIPIYYLNGKIVASPVIELDEWNMLGISFINPLDISYSTGKLKITSNILLDNISYYGLNLVETNQKSSSTTWDDINDGLWSALSTWEYSTVFSYYKIYQNDLKEIYRIYTGTNKIIADSYQEVDGKKLMFNGYEYIGYMDIEKNTIVLDIT
jgi:hypothetical protein